MELTFFDDRYSIPLETWYAYDVRSKSVSFSGGSGSGGPVGRLSLRYCLKFPKGQYSTITQSLSARKKGMDINLCYTDVEQILLAKGNALVAA